MSVLQVLPAEAQARISILASRQDATVPDVFAKSLKRRCVVAALSTLQGARPVQNARPAHVSWKQDAVLGDCAPASSPDTLDTQCIRLS